jgi:hypothetical protein
MKMIDVIGVKNLILINANTEGMWFFRAFFFINYKEINFSLSYLFIL